MRDRKAKDVYYPTILTLYRDTLSMDFLLERDLSSASAKALDSSRACLARPCDDLKREARILSFPKNSSAISPSRDVGTAHASARAQRS